MPAPADGPGGVVVLLAGLWLPAVVWAPVAAELRRRGHRVVAPRLPGVDEVTGTADLAAQLRAVQAVVDAAGRVVLVGHSAASTLAWLVADRRPEQVERVVLVGGLPVPDGSAYASAFPLRDGVVPFPGWEAFEEADIRDLGPATRARVAALAVPVPGAVASGVVRLTDERRLRVPVTVVCPEFSPDDVRGWLAAGELPELARVASVTLVDLDSGHWPMLTRPVELARVVDQAVRRGPARPAG